jgi:hypothetical protein
MINNCVCVYKCALVRVSRLEIKTMRMKRMAVRNVGPLLLLIATQMHYSVIERVQE